MINTAFTPDELLLLIQGLGSRKKIFRNKIRNNKNRMEDGNTELTPKELQRFIDKRTVQMEVMNDLQERLIFAGRLNGIEIPYSISANN